MNIMKMKSILCVVAMFALQSAISQETITYFYQIPLEQEVFSSDDPLGVKAISNLQNTIRFVPGSGTDSAKQKQSVASITGVFSTTNQALSQSSIVEGAGNIAGQWAYRFTNPVGSTITNTLTFSVPPDWEPGDVVSIVNNNKYPNAGTIESIQGNTVVFTSNLNVGGTVKQDDDHDSKLAYVQAKPTKGNIDLGIGAHAEGVNTKALNLYAHAEGYNTSALGEYSHAEGRNTSATYGAHAEGINNTASGDQSHAEGYHTTASGADSHSEGAETTASAYTSHAEGYNTVASSSCAHAEGANTEATQGASHSEGDTTHATGYASHAEGQNTRASGENSHAEGYNTKAKKYASHAEGNDTTADGEAAHSEGKSTQASGFASYAGGISTIAGARAAYVCGENAAAAHDNTFTWNGDTDTYDGSTIYEPHTYWSNKKGTFNINPIGGLSGFYIGKTDLTTILSQYAKIGDVPSEYAIPQNIRDAADEAYNAISNATNLATVKAEMLKFIQAFRDK